MVITSVLVSTAMVDEGVKGGGESGVKEGGGGERPGAESGPALAEWEEVGD